MRCRTSAVSLNAMSVGAAHSRHVVAEVGRRKARLSDLGMATIQELRASADETIPDVVLVVHGADRLLMHGEAQPSPILAPLMGLLSEAVGSGVRILMTGPSSAAHHRLGSSIGRRFVLECPDSQEYSALGVPRPLQGGLDGLGRAVDRSERAPDAVRLGAVEPGGGGH